MKLLYSALLAASGAGFVNAEWRQATETLNQARAAYDELVTCSLDGLGHRVCAEVYQHMQDMGGANGENIEQHLEELSQVNKVNVALRCGVRFEGNIKQWLQPSLPASRSDCSEPTTGTAGAILEAYLENATEACRAAIPGDGDDEKSDNLHRMLDFGHMSQASDRPDDRCFIALNATTAKGEKLRDQFLQETGAIATALKEAAQAGLPDLLGRADEVLEMRNEAVRLRSLIGKKAYIVVDVQKDFTTWLRVNPDAASPEAQEAKQALQVMRDMFVRAATGDFHYSDEHVQHAADLVAHYAKTGAIVPGSLNGFTGAPLPALRRFDGGFPGAPKPEGQALGWLDSNTLIEGLNELRRRHPWHEVIYTGDHHPVQHISCWQPRCFASDATAITDALNTLGEDNKVAGLRREFQEVSVINYDDFVNKAAEIVVQAAAVADVNDVAGGINWLADQVYEARKVDPAKRDPVCHWEMMRPAGGIHLRHHGQAIPQPVFPAHCLHNPETFMPLQDGEVDGVIIGTGAELNPQLELGASFQGYNEEAMWNIESSRTEVLWPKAHMHNQDSFSAAVLTNEMTPTGLFEYLNSKGITEVVMGGIVFTICVGNSARHLHNYPINATQLEAAHPNYPFFPFKSAAGKYELPAILSGGDITANHGAEVGGSNLRGAEVELQSLAEEYPHLVPLLTVVNETKNLQGKGFDITLVNDLVSFFVFLLICYYLYCTN
ncbi:MAG: hypothetical protein MHM6MM_004898 [Cercozoa sp. M6MM]